MSTHVYVKAVRDDSQAKDFAEMWRKCAKYDIEVPDEVQEFFGHVEPAKGKAMAVVDIPAEAVREFSDDCREFQEVDLSKLPPGTKFLRVCISY